MSCANARIYGRGYEYADRLCFSLGGKRTPRGQDSYKLTPFDIADGKQLFQDSCTGCHGPDGDSIAGVDLGRGKFRRASSDYDLIEIIRTGIKDTGMPPNDFSKWEASVIVAYLRSMAATASTASSSGDADRGKTLFEGKGACLNCHRIRDKGSRIGPDLTDVGALRRSAELERSILEPDAEILFSNRFVRVVTPDGSVITGRLLNHDPFSVQMIDAKQRLLSFSKSNIAEFSFTSKSSMPPYQGKFSPQELADLVSYLVSQKGLKSQ